MLSGCVVGIALGLAGASAGAAYLARKAGAPPLTTEGSPDPHLYLAHGLSAEVIPAPPGQMPLLGPIQKDAYGPGVHSDATGRPFEWQTEEDEAVLFGPVKPDA